MGQRRKPKYNIRQTISFMFGRAWRYGKSMLFISLGLVVINVGINLMQLLIAPQILTKVELAVSIGELLGTITFFGGGLYLLNALKGYLDTYNIAGRSLVRFSMRNEIIKKACLTSYSNTSNPEIMKLQEHAFFQTRNQRMALFRFYETLKLLITDCICFVIYLALLSRLNTYLTLLVLITSVISYFITKRLRKWGFLHRAEQAAYRKKFLYISDKAESVALAKDIRIFGLQSWLDEIQSSFYSAYSAFINKREGIYRIVSIVDVLMQLMRNGFAYVFLIMAVLRRELTASEFLLYFSTVGVFTEKVTGILGKVAEVYEEHLDISGVQEYLNLPEQFQFEEGEQIPQAEAYELKLENVSYRYPGSDVDLFCNLNLVLAPGEKVAVVGLNGAGKTTLVKLLCGLLDPDKGSVCLNGEDIRKYNRREYYQLFSAIFQDYSIPDVTLKENIALDSEDIDEEKVWTCLEKAGLAEVANKLPAGLETHIGKDIFQDGILLSGGQIQRMILARALYKDGAILVLDEPTAALDPLAEDHIYKKYHEMTAGKTAVFISHRLASTRFCDRILFLEKGKMIEEGTHEQLLKRGGAYAEMYEIQSRYYQEGRDLRHEEL